MKIIKILFSSSAMGSLFAIFAVAMAVATFIENDYGSGAAYSMVYNTRWFELILLLLSINLVGQMVILRFFRKSKLPVTLFHLSFILMIMGAGITRYFGWEGTIRIREGEKANNCYSAEKHLGYIVKNAAGEVVASDSKKYFMTSSSADNYKKKISAGNKDYELVLARIIPNAVESVTESPDGEAIVSLFIMTDMTSGENIIIKKGEIKSALGISIGFGYDGETDLRINLDSASFYLTSSDSLGLMSMMTRKSAVSAPETPMKMEPMQIFTLRGVRIVPQKLLISGSVKAITAGTDQNTGQNAFIFHLFAGTESETIYLWDKASDPVATGSCTMDGMDFQVTYGSAITELPFDLVLNDFVLERYPGSNSPSGYRSNVTLIDKANNTEKPFSIFMNNILKYKGYRFYQSSYDQDEKGTVLSVSHDVAGMLVTYTGYSLLFLFIILSLFSRNSMFRTVNAQLWASSLRKGAAVIVLIILVSGAATIKAQKFIPSREASEEFGKVLVQDQKGRTKPLLTLSNDILRKVTRENKFEGYTSMQVFLGLYLDFNNWKETPLIKISNKDLQRKVGIIGNYAAFNDLVDLDGTGSYKLSEEVNTAYSKAPAERDKMDKEVMKVDERVNIVYMIYRGDFMKIFPLKDGSHNWGSPEESLKSIVSPEDSVYLKTIIPLLADAMQNNNVANVEKIISSIGDYQTRFTEYSLPAEGRTDAEMFYYKLGIFERLFPFYSATGLIMLIGLIIMVIRGRTETSLFVRILGWILFAAFLFHTFGLGLRWYISGHSPMSNGYESMIFISWVTLLAGFIFSRKSAFALSATAVLAGMTLMVAHLSFMDPEITNLVPVLKSYWLTLHVSIITGSYGFLGLGAILGIIIMILLSLVNNNNRERISNTIDELTVINFRTLTLGLYFLTIGTFLGAVWANESWGRYWGWDPKETWSLITIIVYTFVTHSRRIPGMKDIYTFSVLSLFAFSSVLMTYFGVNYYLSGLHSYASGDPVPVPSFVYIAIVLMVSLSVIAYIKYNRFKKPEPGK